MHSSDIINVIETMKKIAIGSCWESIQRFIYLIQVQKQ